MRMLNRPVACIDAASGHRHDQYGIRVTYQDYGLSKFAHTQGVEGVGLGQPRASPVVLRTPSGPAAHGDAEPAQLPEQLMTGGVHRGCVPQQRFRLRLNPREAVGSIGQELSHRHCTLFLVARPARQREVGDPIASTPRRGWMCSIWSGTPAAPQ